MNIEDNYQVCYYKYCQHKKIFAFDQKEIHQSHNQYVSQSMESFSNIVENTTCLQIQQYIKRQQNELMKLGNIQVLNEEICQYIKQIQIQINQVLERLRNKIISNNNQLQHQENIQQQFLQSAQSIRNLQFNENDVLFMQNYLDGLIAPKFEAFELQRNEILNYNRKIMKQIQEDSQNLCQKISILESTSIIKTLEYEMTQQFEIQTQSVVEILDLNPYGIEEIIMNVRSNDFKRGNLQILNNDYIMQYEVMGVFYEPRYLKSQNNVDSIVLFDLNSKMVKLLQKRQGISICLSGSRSYMQWHPCNEISQLKDLSKVISISYQKQNRVFFIDYMNERGYQVSKRIDLKSGSIEILNNKTSKLRSFHPERLNEIQVGFTDTISFEINNKYQPLAFKLHQEPILEFHFVDNDYLLTYDAKGMVKIWDTDYLHKNAWEKSQETISCLSKIAINDKPILFDKMEKFYVILGQKKYFYIIGFQEEQLKLVGKLILSYQDIEHMQLRDKNKKFEIICKFSNSQIIRVWSVDK